MQENISVTDSYSTGNAAQAMLEKLLQIYDVKTLVAQLNGVGENHWSAAILKRALANDSAWHRLSEKEFAHLQTLLPKPPAHHPHYAFRFIDLFAGIGGIRRGFESIGGQCVFTSEWNKHAVRTYKANHYCDPATHHFNEDIRDITLSHKDGVSDEAAAEHIRQHIPGRRGNGAEDHCRAGGREHQVRNLLQAHHRHGDAAGRVLRIEVVRH